ncbi:hypothetical protein PoB_000171700 [Plakobranchus ocellatus]|uniref:Uncharacterized protein n=1 Tax=Plakobranchus ocellatus TaxID=259542 RepID=A0AAV3XXL5_9GAST|nr:hypothetical protein PoB_000171700 [Plakobranchus ocellatus]
MVTGIVSGTDDILWGELHPMHMSVPSCESLRSIAQEMWDFWDFPSYTGALSDRVAATLYDTLNAVLDVSKDTSVGPSPDVVESPKNDKRLCPSQNQGQQNLHQRRT